MMLSQGVAGIGKLSQCEHFCNIVSPIAPRSRPARRVTAANRHSHSIHAVAEAPVLPFSKDAEHLEQWSKNSWRKRTAHQQPEYVDKEQLQEAVAEIQRMPPLVFAGECRTLQARLAKCAAGESFMLTGGDCAGIAHTLSSDCAVQFLHTILAQSHSKAICSHVHNLHSLRSKDSWKSKKLSRHSTVTRLLLQVLAGLHMSFTAAMQTVTSRVASVR